MIQCTTCGLEEGSSLHTQSGAECEAFMQQEGRHCSATHEHHAFVLDREHLQEELEKLSSLTLSRLHVAVFKMRAVSR